MQWIRETLLNLGDADKRLTQVELARLVSDRRRGNLAKFQPYLPPSLEGAYLSERMFDVVGVSSLARGSAFEIV